MKGEGKGRLGCQWGSCSDPKLDMALSLEGWKLLGMWRFLEKASPSISP